MVLRVLIVVRALSLSLSLISFLVEQLSPARVYLLQNRRNRPMASKREQVKMKSPESGHHYYTKKNKSNTPARMELRKYDPTLRKHVVFKETK